MRHVAPNGAYMAKPWLGFHEPAVAAVAASPDATAEKGLRKGGINCASVTLCNPCVTGGIHP